jgi:hypothetical protein
MLETKLESLRVERWLEVLTLEQYPTEVLKR